MRIIIKTKNTKLNPVLKKIIEEKINSLEKFTKILHNEKYYNHISGKEKPKIEAWVEIGKETLHHKKGPFFRAECQLRFPGRSLRSTAENQNLKLAINEIKDELQRELKEYKEKLVAQTKKRARVLKKELKISSLARFYRKSRIREVGI